MNESLHARLADTAFALITGLDIADGFDTPAPQHLDLGPSDNPADRDVAMDDDRDLPWPDASKVASWWAAHQCRFAQVPPFNMCVPMRPRGDEARKNERARVHVSCPKGQPQQRRCVNVDIEDYH